MCNSLPSYGRKLEGGTNIHFYIFNFKGCVCKSVERRAHLKAIISEPFQSSFKYYH